MDHKEFRKLLTHQLDLFIIDIEKANSTRNPHLDDMVEITFENFIKWITHDRNKEMLKTIDENKKATE